MPITALTTLSASITQKSARQREAAQHAPRPSRVRFTVRTVGVGESRLIGAKALDFGALLIDEPSFAFGVVAATPLGNGQLPYATATVLTWLRNSNGLYTGAEVGFRVDSLKTDINLKFSLTFEASTIRSTVGTGTQTTSTVAANTYTGTIDQAGL